MSINYSKNKINFQPLGNKKVEARFDGGTLTTDGGGLLLREIDKRFNIIKRFAAAFYDKRCQRKIEHPVARLIAQRIFGLCLGYEDLNDHEELRKDPLFALLCEVADLEGKNRKQGRNKGMALAGKSTLNRLETAGVDEGKNSRYKKIFYNEHVIEELLVELFLETYNRGKEPKEIILDIDSTDDLLHGMQEGRHFHGHYDGYCYLPVYIFCEGHLLSARLKTADKDPGRESIDDIKKVVSLIRKRWPTVNILLRGDSGFAKNELMDWCDGLNKSSKINRTDYLFGYPPNSRLKEEMKKEMEKVKKRYEKYGTKQKLYGGFQYKTIKSWKEERRIVGKVEYDDRGINYRFIVTSLPKSKVKNKKLYEKVYCARGDMENRIKEQKLDMFSDRTSSHTMRANQLRLYFSALAFVIMHLLRSYGLSETEFKNAQCGTIRLKLLKIAARVKISYRRVLISYADGYPYKDQFFKIKHAIVMQT